MTDTHPPPIFLLDLDGTVIGDITPQVLLYDIVQQIRSSKQQTKQQATTNSSQPSFPIKEFHEKLRDGIVRPYFDLFMAEVQKRGIEVFIYTASSRKWAEFLVKQIEIAFNIKFNRPILSRDHCHIEDGECKKRLSTIAPLVMRTINKKYGVKYNVNEIVSNMMVIDNSEVYHGQDCERVLLCDTYKYKYPENMIVTLNKNVYQTYNTIIQQVMVANMNNFRPTKNFMKFERQFYQMYVNAVGECLVMKEKCMQDTMFRTVTRCIVHKNIKTFNKNSIRYLQHKLHEELQQQQH